MFPQKNRAADIRIVVRRDDDAQSDDAGPARRRDGKILGASVTRGKLKIVKAVHSTPNCQPKNTARATPMVSN